LSLKHKLHLSGKILMMDEHTIAQVYERADAIYLAESRRVLATLIRLLGDFDLAEDALHEAFRVALEQWPRDGVPANPRAWLVSTGRFKAIDALRRHARFDTSLEEVAERLDRDTRNVVGRNDEDIEDDRLRLIFTCCHPALPPEARVALTLREVCGLTTEAIAHAFLTTPSTLAQRIVRAKAKIRAGHLPYEVPAGTSWNAGGLCSSNLSGSTRDTGQSGWRHAPIFQVRPSAWDVCW
jgi:RNA polymerase sigma-70 factor (ECF subfamily)